MRYFALVLGFLKKYKPLAILCLVAMVTMLLCWRWRSVFHPWWLIMLITVGSTALVLGILTLWKMRGEKKAAAGLEAGLAAGGDEDKVDLRGEIQALRDNWQRTLEQLKSSRMGSEGGAVLSRLPWYIIIGEPASGKSTLLRKSGLDFPVGDAAIRGTHGTRNCDWWFANEAIFLDTAGRYVIETQEAEWVAFLDLLKKHRKNRPINGVLIALPANSLLTKSHEDLQEDGKRIRNRIDELIEHLGVNFPIYVLVTKCDLVSGFVEFFGPLDDRYREQMIGWTNPPDPEARFDSEVFDRRFDKVSQVLFRMRPWLGSQGKKVELGKSFLFPEEFCYLAPPLRDVLDVVFRTNVYQETPICRGVYFSSGTQVGAPLAKALEDMKRELSISDDFGLGPGIQEEKEVRTYFIKDLVGEQILRDKEMSFRTQQAESRARRRTVGWSVTAIAAAVLLLILSTTAFMTNHTRITDFVGMVGVPEEERPVETLAGCVDTWKEAVDARLIDAGLNYSDEIKPTIEEAYRELFVEACLDPMLADLKGRLEARIPTREDPERGKTI
ncbi:MAG: type VI secretion protein IcmF/TssM N-terminal domain-containing protein, partial [Planctomycetota bacterium]